MLEIAVGDKETEGGAQVVPLRIGGGRAVSKRVTEVQRRDGEGKKGNFEKSRGLGGLPRELSE